MTRMRFPLALALIACGTFSGCSGEDKAETTPAERQALVTPAPPNPAAAELKGGADTAPSEATIPAGFHGRWGLVPEDCTSTRGDAKGLLMIDPTGLRFYESVGILAKVTEDGERSLRGSFAFTGEGMEWTRDMVLEVGDGGRTLVRREFGEDAHPGPLTYRRCE